jgi:hypothetical protein
VLLASDDDGYLFTFFAYNFKVRVYTAAAAADRFACAARCTR